MPFPSDYVSVHTIAYRSCPPGPYSTRVSRTTLRADSWATVPSKYSSLQSTPRTTRYITSLSRSQPLDPNLTLTPYTQQLICLALQIVANLAISPANHQVLIDAELPDSLMQLILPSDEWFYTNTTTKYAKYVKHQSARIMVYLGLEKRLRHKVYLFDLLGM